MRALPIISIMLVLFLAGCGPAAVNAPAPTADHPSPAALIPSLEPSTAPSSVGTTIASPAPASPATSYTDPFAYCGAVTTIDSPDARYTGPAVPDSIAMGLKRAYQAPADAPLDSFRQGTSWRCMGGRVYACTVGANLPCAAKADTNRTPTAATTEFCQNSPNADVIPIVVTGRETIFEWRCSDGKPAIVRAIAQPDAQGFIANIWYQINPDGTAAPDETNS